MCSADWQPAPPVATGPPVTFQTGSVGAGIGVGCGIGIGFGGPLSLGALPIFGQAVQGISAGLGGVLPIVSGAGAAARAAVKGLGIQGLDAGVGCGVGIGYGFGAGLMVKPSVVEYALKSGSQLLGQFAHATRSKLQATGVPNSMSSHQQQQPSSNDITTHHSTSNMPALGPYVSSAGSSPAVALPPAASTSGAGGSWDVSGMTGGPANVSISPTLGTVPGRHEEELARHQAQQATTISSISNSSGAAGQQDQQVGAQDQQQDNLVLRTLLQQQEEITLLKKQNTQLRQAICKLDPRAPFCDGSGKNKRSNRQRRLQGGADSSDWPG